MKKSKYVPSSAQKVSIGVMGTGKGVGTTHISLLLGNFLYKTKGARVMVIEQNKENDFEKLLSAYEEEATVINEREFILNHITYCTKIVQTELGILLSRDYDYFIWDMGCEIKKNSNEFLRCNKKIIVTTLTEWKKKEVESAMELLLQLQGAYDWNYVYVFGPKEDNILLYKKYGVKIQPFLYENDSTCLTKRVKQLCSRLLE